MRFWRFEYCLKTIFSEICREIRIVYLKIGFGKKKKKYMPPQFYFQLDYERTFFRNDEKPVKLHYNRKERAKYKRIFSSLLPNQFLHFLSE